MKTTLVLNLTEKEVELLKKSTSNLGTNDSAAVSLQLKIANEILFAKTEGDAGLDKDEQ